MSFEKFSLVVLLTFSDLYMILSASLAKTIFSVPEDIRTDPRLPKCFESLPPIAVLRCSLL